MIQDYGDQTGEDQTPTDANSADEYGQESRDDDAQSAERSEASHLWPRLSMPSVRAFLLGNLDLGEW